MTYTKKTRIILWILRVLDFVILFAPLVVYFAIALANGNVSNMRKFALTGFTALACVIVLINVFIQKKKTSPRWLIILGLYICIKEFLMPLIITLAVVSILDDFVFSPLINHYKGQLVASKTYDKRLEFEERLKND